MAAFGKGVRPYRIAHKEMIYLPFADDAAVYVGDILKLDITEEGLILADSAGDPKFAVTGETKAANAGGLIGVWPICPGDVWWIVGSPAGAGLSTHIGDKYDFADIGTQSLGVNSGAYLDTSATTEHEFMVVGMQQLVDHDPATDYPVYLGQFCIDLIQSYAST
ncbi:MAG: hypothetical protein GF355_09605 [Candidatus Eisenbacteria bacterium]|nr:hypothetical protein [Candidatus Eisenbacteria bacterium]